MSKRNAGICTSAAAVLALGCGMVDIFAPAAPAPTATHTHTSTITAAATLTPAETRKPKPTHTSTPSDTPVPVEVEPYNSGTDNGYHTLKSLSDDNKSPYEVFLHSDEPAVIQFGWCSVSTSKLNEELSHISWNIVADSREIPMSRFHSYTMKAGSYYCRYYAGIVRSWSPGEHRIVITRTLDTEISSARGVFPPGEQVDIYIVKVTA